MTATSGRRLSELYTKSDPLGSLARTLLESSRWFSPARRLKWEAVTLCSEKITEKEYCYGRNTSLKPSAVTLNEKVTKSGRLLFRLVPSERPTDGTGCGLLQEELLPTPQTQGLKVCNAEGETEFMPFELLPTPTSIDSGGGRINKSPSPGAKERPTIALAAKMGLLPTPMSTDIHHAERVEELKQGWTLELNDMAVGGLLPTPAAQDGKNSTLPPSQSDRDTLPVMIGQHCQQTDGATSQLNPLFVQEMMGFPYLWTELPFQSGGRNP